MQGGDPQVREREREREKREREGGVERERERGRRKKEEREGDEEMSKREYNVMNMGALESRPRLSSGYA